MFESEKQSVDSRNVFLNMVKVPCIVHEVRSDRRRDLDLRSAIRSELRVSGLVSTLLLSFDQ